jgi:uncharacterized small protein (DUF1192 family)
MIIDKADALQSLRPGAQWVLRGDDLEWLDTEQTQPTEAEITAEIARLQAEHERNEYQRQRAAEYPPMVNYLDGIVKGDTEQVQTYIDACLAVKVKYPKPE